MCLYDEMVSIVSERQQYATTRDQLLSQGASAEQELRSLRAVRDANEERYTEVRERFKAAFGHDALCALYEAHA